MFEEEPLSFVVTEFNRYNHVQLTIADSALGEQKITGVFNINDQEAFLALISALGIIQVEQDDDGLRLFRRIPSGG